MKPEVTIDKRVSFGRPCVKGTGIPTGALADRFRGGDSIYDPSYDYQLSREQVEAALRYELATPALKRKLSKVVNK